MTASFKSHLEGSITCKHARTHTCTHAHACIHAHMNMHTHTCTHTHAHAHMHTRMHTHTHTRTHTHTHTYTHTHTHTMYPVSKELFRIHLPAFLVAGSVLVKGGYHSMLHTPCLQPSLSFHFLYFI